MKCPNCQCENEPEARYCEECATPLARGCPKCGNPVRESAKFCPNCAQPLSVPSSPTNRASPASYVPQHLVDKILSSKATLEGERKQVTVLFADLKGSMELLADRDPEEARKILDPVLERMMEAVHRYDGTVNQVMGDGIMALFGAPFALEDHAVRACYAALAMQSAIRNYSEEVRRSQGVPPLQIRIGLNSGEVVVGAIGSDLRMEYTAVGHTTHLAARMEQLAAPGTTLFTGATLQLVEGYVAVKRHGPIPVKGLSEPVDVFELTGTGTARSRLQAAAARGLTKFVGRSGEHAHMNEALERAAAGHGEIVALVGEPGVGKSRLVWEFTHSHRTQGWLIIESASVSYGKAAAYRPVIDLLKAYFQIEDRNDSRRIREKVTGKLLALDETLKPIIAPCLSLLDVPVEDPQWEGLDPPQRRLRILESCKRLLLRESQIQPLLLVFEDLHWIDNETQAFLDSLVESLPTAHVFLLVNYRPEYQHRWGAKTYYTQLRIDPLSGENAEILLSALLGEDASLLALKRLLIERTEGNPLFLEESVRTLVETGRLQGSRGAYQLTVPTAELHVPATVQAIIAARIDRLAPEDKRLLQAAAVIGKDVPYPLLRAIAGLPEEQLRRGLASLQAAEFLYETSLFPDLEYTFKHALTHEVAYGSVLQERRCTLHASILDAVEQVYAGRLDENVDRLAHHALRGEVWNKALAYLRHAGEKAIARAANREAVMHFEQAIMVLPHLPETRATLEQAVDLRLAMRWCWMPLGGLAEVAEHARKAQPLAKALNDPRREALIHCSMSSAILGESTNAIEHARLALEIADSLNDPTLRIISKWFLGRPYLELGAYSKAVQFFQIDVGLESQDIAAYLMGQLEQATPYGTFAAYSYCVAEGDTSHCLAELGKFDEAMVYAKRALEFAEKLENLVLRAFQEANLAFVYMRKGEHQTALTLAEGWLQTYRDAELPLPAQIMASRLGPIFNLCDRIPEAVALFETAQQFSEPRNLVGFLQPELAWLAHAYGRAGRTDEAVTFGQRALELARKYGQRGNEAWTLYVLGDIYGSLPQPDRAYEAYQQALALGAELGMRPLEAQCLLGLGELARKSDKDREAQEQLTRACGMFREMGMRFWLDKTEAALKAL